MKNLKMKLSTLALFAILAMGVTLTSCHKDNKVIIDEHKKNSEFNPYFEKENASGGDKIKKWIKAHSGRSADNFQEELKCAGNGGCGKCPAICLGGSTIAPPINDPNPNDEETPVQVTIYQLASGPMVEIQFPFSPEKFIGANGILRLTNEMILSKNDFNGLVKDVVVPAGSYTSSISLDGIQHSNIQAAFVN